MDLVLSHHRGGISFGF